MLRHTKKPSSGSHSQCLAKITRIGSALIYTSCRRCQCYGGILCRHSTDNVCTTYLSTLNQFV